MHKKLFCAFFLAAASATACSSNDQAIPTTTAEASPTTQKELTTTTFETVQEFQVSTTANLQEKNIIDQKGQEITQAWWYPQEETTYTELAETLEEKQLITAELAEKWKQQGDQTVTPVAEEITIIKMWPVRVAEQTATFQISSKNNTDLDETLTFIEFVKNDTLWKASDIS